LGVYFIIRVQELEEKKMMEIPPEPKAKSFLQLEKPRTRLDEIIGLKNVKEKIKENILIPFKFPDLFTGVRAYTPKILLYGVIFIMLVN